MTILKELVVANGNYTTKNGDEKTRWITIGHLHESGDATKQYITLERHINLAAFPMRDNGDTRVYANLFKPTPKDGEGGNGVEQAKPRYNGGNGGKPANPSMGNLEDDIPF